MRFTGRLAALFAAALSFVPVMAFSQAYPVKPVRVLIPWPPGGSNDIVGRVVFQKMSQQFAQRLRSDYAKYEKLIRMTGAQID